MTAGRLSRAWAGFREFLARRVALLRFLSALATAWLLLQGVPLPEYWETVYDRMRLDFTWPLVALFLGLLFRGFSLRVYRHRGAPQFFPALATAAVGIFLLMGVSMLTATAADWDARSSWVLVAMLSAGFVVVIPAWMGHTELWRVLFNRSVVHTVLQSMHLSSAGGRPQSRIAGDGTRYPESEFQCRVKKEVTENGWGAEHCLEALRGAYDFLLARVLRVAEGPRGISEADLDDCLDAGSNVLLYLSVRWPEMILRSTRLGWLRVDMARQLGTVYLLAGLAQQARHSARIADWLKTIEEREEAFARLVALCLRLGSGRAPRISPEKGMTPVAEVVELFAAIPPDSEVAQDLRVDLPALAASTWIAFAHKSAPEQLCFDVWMEMQRRRGYDPSSAFHVTELPSDPAAVAARLFLRRWYDAWAAETHEDWNAGLRGRASIRRV